MSTEATMTSICKGFNASWFTCTRYFWRGGEGQWKHHPIYVQQWQFQFIQRLSPHLPHTQCASPRSFPFHIVASHNGRDLKIKVQDSEMHGFSSAKSSACGTSREGKEKRGQLWTRLMYRSSRFLCEDTDSTQGLRQDCISCTHIWDFNLSGSFDLIVTEIGGQPFC